MVDRSDNHGLYDKSCAIYRYKSKKNKLIADKAASIGVRGFDATMLHGWMKSMRTMYGKEKKSKGKSGADAAILMPHQQWVLDSFKFLHFHRNVGTTRKILGKVSNFIK